MPSYEVLSAVHGIAPRSEELFKLGGDVERGRAELSDFEELRDQESADWLAWQESAGIDIKEDGKLRWQDQLHPIVKASRGFDSDVDAAPVTRWFETNTFYRRPTITGPLRFDVAAFSEQVPIVGDTISLLSIKDFSDLCANQYDGLEPFRNITNLYRQVLPALGSLGVKRFVFVRHGDYDTSLAQRGEFVLSQMRDAPEIVKLDSRRKSVFSGPPSGVVTQQGLAERWIPIVESDTTRFDEVPTDSEIAYLARCNISKLVLTNTVDFKFLPLEYAKQKVRRLAEITDYVRGKLGETSNE